MDVNDLALFATQLAMGFALAASVGLRAFLPLLAAGVLARQGYLTLGESFHWMGSTPALVVLGSAVAFEILAALLAIGVLAYGIARLTRGMRRRSHATPAP